MRFNSGLLAALVSLNLAPALAGEFQWNAELGAQGAVNTEDSDLSKGLLYVEPSLKYSFEWSKRKWKTAIDEPVVPTLFEINASVRAWFDSQSVRPVNVRGFSLNDDPDFYSYELDIRSLNVSVSREKWRFVAGYQEIPWGETFGLPILELVNPRDFRDPLLFDPSWVRLPVPAVQGQLFLGKMTLQGVLNPFPRHNLYPLAGSRFDPTQEIPGVTLKREVIDPPLPFGEFMEFGGRASYLFESGFDISLMVYRHWNRTPVYQLVPTSPASADLLPVESPVNTLGSSVSYSTGAFVFRADTAVGLDGPLQKDAVGGVELGHRIQNSAGADATSDDGWILGLQIQTEVSLLSQNPRRFHWMSGRVSKRFFGDALEAEIFFFGGLNNPDLWVQPKLTWYASERVSISGRLDLLGSSRTPGDGYLWTVNGQSRGLLWLAIKI